jgi:alkylhydroperoxidase family enzyme
MTSRIAPAERPYPNAIDAALAKLMPPGMEPLLLFRVLARDPRLFRKFMGGSLLDKGNLTVRDRELAIARACARSGSEYEWGVHMVVFGERAGFDAADQRATVAPGTEHVGWSKRDRLILRLVDALHDTATIDDALWTEVRAELSDEQILELIMLAGFYRTVSYLTNALRLAPESFAARFPDK